MIPFLPALRILAVLAAYVAIAALYTHPLLRHLGDAVANDRYDPVLNASILWWNATSIPFSPGWWTPPHYYPSAGIAAFTENLVGLSIITTPLFWISRDPVLTYNAAVFLTWPLSALAVYLLAVRLGARPSAAFVGGLAFGFAPYRMTQMAHLQVLACFWLPLALAGLHGYLAQRRVQWLLLFGGAWILQSLTNGYFMLFGGVVIGLWLAYFCSTRGTWRAAGPILVAWGAASLPLAPVMLMYKDIHEAFGLSRDAAAILGYSAEPSAWLQGSRLAAFWGTRLIDGGAEWNLFPGSTVVLLVLLGGCWTIATAPPFTSVSAESRWRRTLRTIAAVVAVVCGLAVLLTVAIGPWRISWLGFTLRMSSIGRALCWCVAAVVGFRLLGGRWPHAGERRPFGFYLLATLASAVFCMGPQLRSGARVLLDPAPYGWLMLLPGFDGLRVPTRFWMIGALCLATAAALAFDRMAPASRRWRLLLAALLSFGILADGWLREMPLARAPEHWPHVEREDIGRAILELPLGPEWDAAATFRAVRHRRRVVNGVSGYDPPHYALLQQGLDAHDTGVLVALASLGPLDVVVDGAADADGALARYVASTPGAHREATDGIRTLFRLSHPSSGAVVIGPAVPILSVGGSDGSSDTALTVDGDVGSGWRRAPQASGAWVLLDLGAAGQVAALTYALGRSINDFPRAAAVEVSLDGAKWEVVWQGSGRGPAVAAVMRAPLDARLVLPFPPRSARYVRLRLLADAQAAWTIAELGVHAPAARDGGGTR